MLSEYIVSYIELGKLRFDRMKQLGMVSLKPNVDGLDVNPIESHTF
jgi:hypothetical protein